MLCPHCKSETRGSGQSSVNGLRCRNCGKSIGRALVDEHSIQQARDILAKWSSNDLLDRISSLPEIPAIPSPHFSGVTADVEDPADEKESHDPQSVNESESDSGVDVMISANQESDSHEISVDQPDEARSAVESESESESQMASEVASKIEPSLPVESERASDTSTADCTDSNDSQTAAVPPGDEDASSVVQEFPVSTVHQDEQPNEEHETQEESVADLHAGVTPTSSATHEHNEQPKPKSKQRRRQRRPVQQRQHQNRKRRAEVSSKGSSAVTRKYRIDTPGEDAGNVSAGATTDADNGTIKSNSGTGGGRYRIDTAEPVAETVGTGDTRTRTQGRSRRRYIDEPHDSAIRGPHFQVTAPRRSNITTITGQFLAYAGVLGLTIGTAMVIYGHFGGYSDYTPTGWLVTTVAQMMLFLGVINLVSGGIEQTNDDVSQRINVLGEQLMRIEQVTEEALRGPKIPAYRYANPDATVETDREFVAAGEPE